MMIATLRAEWRKLFTIRSTYITSLLALFIIGLVNFIGVYRSGGAGMARLTLQNTILDSMNIAGIFVGIVAILLIAHEYRYNTISYTLTQSSRRLKVLLAKIMVAALYGLIMTLAVAIVAVGIMYLAAAIKGFSIPGQDVAILSVAWRSTAYIVGMALAGLLFGFLFRSVVFSLAVYFLVPTMVETLLHTLLKLNHNYMPFMALGQIVVPMEANSFSPLKSAGVFYAYLVVGWIIAAILFVRRDAN